MKIMVGVASGEGRGAAIVVSVLRGKHGVNM